MVLVLLLLLCGPLYVVASNEAASSTTEDANTTATTVSGITNNTEGLELVDQCPDRDDIPNCRCEKRAPFGVMVDCVGFPDTEILRENLDGLVDVKIGMFNLAQPEFAAVGYKFFQNITLHRLDIVEWNITSLKSADDESKSFLDALRSSIVHLGVVNCPVLEEWDWKLLKDMKHLSHIYVTATPVKAVTKTISLVTNLQAITFYGTKTESVEAGAFSGLRKLVALTIKDNSLLSFTRNLLPSPAPNLHYLGLGANNISSLPDDMFTSMPQLKYLELEDNLLTRLKNVALDPVFKQLALLNVQGNPLQCDKELKWIIDEKKPEQNDFNLTTCQSPKNLLGRKLASLKASELVDLN